MPDMTADEARRRFAASPVARLATVGPEGLPHLVPVVFALHGDEIVTAVDHKPKRSTRLKRLRNIAAHPTVCLLVDAYDDDWDRLWWVRADGDARVVPPDTAEARARAEHAAAVALLGRKFPQYRELPPRGPVIVVTVRRWAGWRAASGRDPEV